MLTVGAWRSWAWRAVALALCVLSLALVVAGRVDPVEATSGTPQQLAFWALAIAATATMTLGPGLVLVRLGLWAPRVGMGAIPLPGFLAMAAIGAAAWVLGGLISPYRTCVAGVAVVSLAVAAGAIVPRGRARIPIDRRALAVLAVLVVVVVGRDLYSLGPTAELYGGTVSRTMEASNRPDSRISYHIVQLIANSIHPHSALGEQNFRPYSFGSRGPLTGLMSAPIVLVTGARVPVGTPDQPWMPFDPEGFAAYRLAMEMFAIAALLAVFGLVAHLTSRDGGLFALLLAATTPFVVHEVYYTWPKLLVGGLMVLAAHQVLLRGWGRAGLVSGLAYLAHPLALFSVPALALLGFFAADRRRALLGGAVVVAIPALFLGGWTLLNHADASQGMFVAYVLQADAGPATSVQQWLGTRIESLANTFVPMHVYATHLRDPQVNALVIRRRVIVFFVQYWTSVPFAAGLLFAPLLLVGLVRAALRSPLLVGAVVVVPVLVFATYWGSFDTGLMREGLQGWLLGLVVVYSWYRASSGWRPPWERWLLLSRIPETMLMMVMPAMWTQWRVLDARFEGTDLLGLGMMAVGLAALAALTFRSAGATLRRAGGALTAASG